MLTKKQVWCQIKIWEMERMAVELSQPCAEKDAELKRLDECLKDARVQVSPEEAKEFQSQVERERAAIRS